MSFDAFKKRNNMSDMVQSIKEQSTKKEYANEFYYPVLEKETGKAAAVIRFLPSKTENELPFITMYTHGFKGDDGRWLFVDLCPTSIGKECLICQQNSELWKTEIKENKDIASKRKRKKYYIFNILVIKDPTQPELEGTVQVFRVGQTIYDKVLAAMSPEFSDQIAKDPFDVFEGYDFYLNIKRDKTKDDQITYDACRFADVATPICDGDENKMKQVYESMIDLKDKYLNENRLLSDSVMVEKVSKAYSRANIAPISLQQSMPQDIQMDNTVPDWMTDTSETSNIEETLDDSDNWLAELSNDINSVNTELL